MADVLVDREAADEEEDDGSDDGEGDAGVVDVRIQDLVCWSQGQSTKSHTTHIAINSPYRGSNARLGNSINSPLQASILATCIDAFRCAFKTFRSTDHGQARHGAGTHLSRGGDLYMGGGVSDKTIIC